MALEVVIETCVKDRKFSGLAALGEEKRKLVLVKEKLQSHVLLNGEATTRGVIEPGVTCSGVDSREADIAVKVAELDERIVISNIHGCIA